MEESERGEEEKLEIVKPPEKEWIPKTEIGRLVKEGKIRNIDEILARGIRIKEVEIVDTLLPNLEYDFLLIGQAKGKFGGGRRKIFRVTQRKTAEGSVSKFTCAAVVGNRDGYVGVGLGSGRESVIAREKALRNAKLNIIKVKRGCGSWECGCGREHSIPFKTEGKVGSVRVILKPAPRGLGLCIGEECKRILELAGIKDVWSQTFGETRTRINLIFACFEALKNLSRIKT
ncbi:MAG: 30S ribosomal protein S5 [Candidatus Nanoarchaeia archaeon]|nr:30S ribosomal protein S5 [Candidatus Haiyanarchaeum thermophilum]MCW1303119.1 30S ribosomal protein S5 [Candidatus Haiyanarchaeum thermophilum]MCW1303784.1 30S ribosomal protein S5 [Candidatus Haiyanarchaeum thermophilum]MCW1306601.1 30S ribosomal protein S5 [Candidatus Haiyanarchaeum thermophilum]MCW1307013.1 30S ribosomal protein S5 [Candidatus Haiyanarchaeum thermophilum]